MKQFAFILLFQFAISGFLCAQSWEITEVGTLPEAVSNNAVVEGVVNGVPYIYSFSGIDLSKIFSGVHLKAWRFNTQNGQTESLPSLPDNMGKIGVGISRLDNTIYIMGGYSVLSNGNEITSNKVHRFDMVSNSYLPDGQQIPVPTDDHVQAVWRDSLIYVVTGWNNTTNIPNVQIYNPSTDTWQAGTSVPNNFNYTAFGASGVIIQDTIFYFGGAAAIFPTGNPFPIQTRLRKGVINPDNPTEITWTMDQFAADVNGYRMGATTVGERAFWLGGSGTTYNFNGIAYNNTGGVPPLNRSLYFDPATAEWAISFHDPIPMDLRGVGSVNDSTKYLMGGMLANQTVSDKVFRLTWKEGLTSVEQTPIRQSAIQLFPNPANEQLTIELTENYPHKTPLTLLNTQGQIVQTIAIASNTTTLTIAVGQLNNGIYLLQYFNDEGGVETQKISIVHP